MPEWEKIDVKIHTNLIFIKAKGIAWHVSYKNITIGLLFFSGEVRFINKKDWKKGWKFKVAFEENGNKYFYRYVGK